MTSTLAYGTSGVALTLAYGTGGGLRTLAYGTGGSKRTLAYGTSASAAVPDYEVVFGPDCAYTEVRISLNWTAEANVVVVVSSTTGDDFNGVLLSTTSEQAIVRFTPPTDGVYLVGVSSDSGRLFLRKVLVFCKTNLCVRKLNPEFATGGRNGQAAPEVPEGWAQAAARLEGARACATTEDWATAQTAIESIQPWCVNCVCGCN